MKFGTGSIPARVMLVGEAFGADEEAAGQPFVGASGQELNRLLHEAGIMRSECYVSNVVNACPPQNDIGAWIATKKKDITPAHVQLRDRYVLPIIRLGFEQLVEEIKQVQPNLIIAFGNTACWALTGMWGVTKWRGSHLTVDVEGLPPIKCVPSIHPASVLRQWDQRALVLTDLRRAKRHMTTRKWNPPEWKFQIAPSYEQVMFTLHDLQERAREQELDNVGPLWLDFDLETAAKHIDCAGISWSRTEALCIPFMKRGSPEGYWSLDEEAAIVYALWKLLTHTNVRVRWQNGLYDAQYTYRRWLFIPRGAQDTMISQHALFVALPKGLGFLGSMYAEWFVYWKEEGKNLDGNLTPERGWAYNCQDCIYTREVGEVQTSIAESMGLTAVHQFQQDFFWPVLRTMNRGIRVIEPERARLALEIQEAISEREAFITFILGHPINPSSPLQMQRLFYEDLGQQPVMTRATKYKAAHVTCDDEALQKIASREPLLRPLITAIADMRTLGVLLSTFVMASVDEDGRMRCSYNIGGNAGGKSAPYTYRLSSNKNAFDTGANLQNIPSDKSKTVGKAAARAKNNTSTSGPVVFPLPNMRSMYGPDPGYTFFDLDLDRADLQIVVWESGEEEFKAALRLGVDMHLLNAFIIAGKEPPPYEELCETHPSYHDHRGPLKLKREFAKVFCHATNYGASARTVAGHIGETVNATERSQRIWFGAHPGIKEWHLRTENSIKSRRYVQNPFGYRWHIFDRVDGVLPEALAWLPQSTVACVINRGWMNIDRDLPEVQVLLQVHDSLGGQFPSHRRETLLPLITKACAITIPYPEPLIIPTGIKTSTVSWGKCS